MKAFRDEFWKLANLLLIGQKHSHCYGLRANTVLLPELEKQCNTVMSVGFDHLTYCRLILLWNEMNIFYWL